jgi:hypothetical protein
VPDQMRPFTRTIWQALWSDLTRVGQPKLDAPTAAVHLRQVLHRHDVMVRHVGSLWRPRLISTHGVYRVDIDAEADGPSAMVLKMVERSPEADGPPREARLYASNALPLQANGLRSPRFFGLSAFPGGETWHPMSPADRLCRPSLDMHGSWSAPFFAELATVATDHPDMGGQTTLEFQAESEHIDGYRCLDQSELAPY